MTLRSVLEKVQVLEPFAAVFVRELKSVGAGGDSGPRVVPGPDGTRDPAGTT